MAGCSGARKIEDEGLAGVVTSITARKDWPFWATSPAHANRKCPGTIPFSS